MNEPANQPLNSPQLLIPTSMVSPKKGRWIRALVNFVIRLAVKWQLGLVIDIAVLRKRMERLNRQAASAARGIPRQLAPCDGVAAEWLIPEGCRHERVLLYIHGGAFVARTPDVHASMVFPWCQALKCRALVVDYRLAPEHKYPAALNDCLQAYRWLLKQGIKSSDIVIAGDSAGGNLALAALQQLRDEGTALPACGVLISPFMDFSLSGKSALENARHDPMFTHAFAIGIRSFYAEPTEYLDPGVSPLFGRFEGLPPMLIQVGSSELLLDDATRATIKGHAAGIQVQLEIWDRLPHVFQAIPVLPQAGQAASSIVAFVSNNVGWNVSQ